MAAASLKIECLNPTTGRRMYIDAATYKLFYKAISHMLKGKTLTYTELVEGIRTYFKKQKIQFDKSVPW